MITEYWQASFEDGWNPRLSPDGRYLLVGSEACRVIDVATKTVVKTISGGQSASSGWLDRSKCVINADFSGTDRMWRTYRLDAPFFNSPLALGPSLNFNGAGGGVWAGGNTTQIFAGNANGGARQIADGYGATVDETGAVVYSIDVHTSPRLVVWKDDKILRTIIPAGPTSRVLIGADGYVGYGFYGPSWLNTPDNKNMQVGVTLDMKESPPLAFMHQGAVWLATSDDNGVYLRPLGVRDKAIVISIPYEAPYGGAVDVSVVSVGAKMIVASCDAKGRLTVADVPSSTALEPIPAPPVNPVVAPFANALWVGCFFKDSVRYGSDPTAPGSCSVIAEAGLNPTGPIVISRVLIPEYKDRWGQVIAIYVTSEDGNLTTEALSAKSQMDGLGLTRRPVLSYTGPNLIHSSEVDIAGVECYQGNETLENAVNRWKASVFQAVNLSAKVVLICGAYDRSGMLTEDQIVKAQPKYVELSRSTGDRCWGMLYFSWKRPGGAYYHPPVGEWISAVAAAAPVPSLNPERPRVTIVSYGPKQVRVGQGVRAVRALSGGPADRVIWRYRKKGSSAWKIAAINSPHDDDHTYKFSSAGVYEIGAKVEGPGGSDATGSQRLVTVS